MARAVGIRDPQRRRNDAATTPQRRRNDAVAYLFGTQLVAGVSPRVDGSSNKVLWVTKDSLSGVNVLVEGRPFGQSQPVVTIPGGPGITDLPTAGCWTFRLSWGLNGQYSSSTINLQVLPAGTNPMMLPSTPTGA